MYADAATVSSVPETGAPRVGVAVVEARGLAKAYGGVQALRGLDLAVPAGGVFGLLGPNGAGKSTFLRLLLGMVRPSAGSVELFGARLDHRSLARVGGFIESPRFHPFLTGAETLEGLALTAGVAARPAALLALVGLSAATDQRVDGYSLGMKQRLAIAAALVGDPELVILDEPLNGLDPAGIIEMRALIRRLADDERRTVLLSSHLLDEVERVCDRVAILDRGRLVREGTVAELLCAQPTLRLRVRPVEAALRLLPAAPVSAEDDTLRLAIGEEEVPALLSALCGAGIAVFEAAWERRSLEELFLDETGAAAC